MTYRKHNLYVITLNANASQHALASSPIPAASSAPPLASRPPLSTSDSFYPHYLARHNFSSTPSFSSSSFSSSSTPTPPLPPRSVVLVFGEHAREVITTELGLWLSRVLVNRHALDTMLSWPEGLSAFRRQFGSEADVMDDADGKQGSEDKENLLKQILAARDRILQRLIVRVVPVANLAGRISWEAGQTCLRKLPSGVDMNRNWPFRFQPDHPSSESFGGHHPLSESQTQMMLHLLRRQVPLGYVNVHSGEWAVYCGWDSKAAIGPGLPGDMGRLLGRFVSNCQCQAGPAGAVSDYLAFGTSMDFVHTQLGVPYALTLELYGGGGAGRVSDNSWTDPNNKQTKSVDKWPYMEDAGISILPDLVAKDEGEE
eukprot:CAMPEP_0175051818 /NCGR_PEP_ID=MMETSP0052_2-20121109/8019_1 /TAXON_ID=51329 ORGANISM="Polytomella parva, Strain SAG 63-3" /NCGR_SAMPLE_ID=MMETSP0052_2 /ASSEMBLY_ACC=CAM_ASM_000194 /LENGTH=370 /DNA_ID=CAMNT_0016316161 /DNA_START=181 /DNA_END=1290 /DNA_ORIENTATION=-